MTTLDLEINSNLMERIKDLAERHYGNASEVALSRVVETALEMRLLYAERVEEAGGEVEEPIVDWEFGSGPVSEQVRSSVRGFLFKRRNSE